MRRRNAIASGNNSCASSRKRFGFGVSAIFPALLIERVAIALQLGNHTPAPLPAWYLPVGKRMPHQSSEKPRTSSVPRINDSRVLARLRDFKASPALHMADQRAEVIIGRALDHACL